MNTSKMMRVALGVIALAVLGGRPVLAAETSTNAAPVPAEATLVTASGRQVFWRGEQVGVSFTTPLAAPTEAVVTLAPARQALRDAGQGGGFILSTGDQCGPATPEENLFALVETAKTHGGYNARGEL